MIAVYFLVRGVAWGRKQTFIITLFTLVMIFLQPILDTADAGIGTYGYVVTEMNNSNGSSIIRPIIAIVPVILAYMYRNKVNYNDKVINICVNMSLLNFMLNFLATFTNGLYIIRMSTYMNMYNAILYPYLLNVSINKDKNKSVIKLGFYLLYFMWYMFEMTYSGGFVFYSDIIGYFG